MQQNHLDSIYRHAMTSLFAQLPKADTSYLSDWAKSMESQIKEETTNLPEGMRTPTANEISDMEVFAMNYKKQTPSATKRQIRKAIQKRFNVQLLPNTVK